MEALKKADYKTTKVPDKIVIKRVLNGEKELFEILMRRYNPMLYRAVRSYLKVEDDVEDTMQDSYLKAFNKLHQFNHNASFSTWLVRIGINEALQKIRKHSNVQPINGIQNETDIPSSENNTMNPEKQAIQNETCRLLEKAIDQLPEKYRVIYILREIEGMDNKTISECLELTEGNVKVRFYRSKKMLKEKLYEFTDDAELFGFRDTRCDRLVENVMKKI